MPRRWLLRWRFSDPEPEGETLERVFDDYGAAQRFLGRIIETPRLLDWVTGPTELRD